MDDRYYQGYRGRREGGWEQRERPYQPQWRDEDRRESRRYEQEYRPQGWYNEGQREDRSLTQSGWDEPDRPYAREYEPRSYRDFRGSTPDSRERGDYYGPPPRYGEEAPYGRGWEERERQWHEARRNEYGRENRHYEEEIGWRDHRPTREEPRERFRPQRHRSEPQRWW